MEQSNDTGKQSNNTRVYIRWFLIRLIMILFDIVAVNASYLAALFIRFYVASVFNPSGVRYIPAYIHFAPIYTICCILVFSIFRLYSSMWKYAGLNDLNRITIASLVTCVIQVVGSIAFSIRMPITYYFIGAIIQFTLIALSRFSYRFLQMERRRIMKSRSKSTLRIMIVGVGETSRIVTKHLEWNAENGIHTVCMVNLRGNEFGNMFEGIPVVTGLDMIASAVKKYNVESVVLADPVIPSKVRKQIRKICEEIGVGVQDYSYYFQDFRGPVKLHSLMEYSRGPVELVLNGESHSFEDGEQAMMSLDGKYVVKGIFAKDNKMVVELQKDMLVPNDVREDWVRDYKEETGEDISFF